MATAASTSTGGTLSVTQIASVMRAAGWPEDAIPTGIAIVLAESGGNPRAVNTANRNGSVDYGLFQINTVHGSLLSRGDKFNPVDNARMALTVYKQAGNSWKPWSTFNSGKYKDFNSAVAGFGFPVDVAIDVARNAVGAAQTVKQATTGVQQVMEVVTSPTLWMRVLLVLLAIFLIIVGTVVLLRKPIAQAGSVGAKAGIKFATKGLVNV